VACEAEDMAGAAIFIPGCPTRGCAWIVWYDLDSTEPKIVARTERSPVTGEECPPEPDTEIMNHVFAGDPARQVVVDNKTYDMAKIRNGDDIYYLVVLVDCIGVEEG